MKSILWSALLAGGLLLGGAVGASAAPAATGSVIQSALADVALIQDARYRGCRRCVHRDQCGRCVRWRKPMCCPTGKPYRPAYKPKKPKY